MLSAELVQHIASDVPCCQSVCSYVPRVFFRRLCWSLPILPCWLCLYLLVHTSGYDRHRSVFTNIAYYKKYYVLILNFKHRHLFSCIIFFANYREHYNYSILIRLWNVMSIKICDFHLQGDDFFLTTTVNRTRSLSGQTSIH